MEPSATAQYTTAHRQRKTARGFQSSFVTGDGAGRAFDEVVGDGEGAVADAQVKVSQDEGARLIALSESNVPPDGPVPLCDVRM